jgi:diacylglycerol kinase family enzyme
MRFLMVLNLRAGGSADAGVYDFVRALGRTGADITIRFLDRGTGVETLLADAHRFDRIIAVGGDGTASAICYSLRDTPTPVLVYPGGTANLFAMNLGVPGDPLLLAEIASGSTIASVDLGELEFEQQGAVRRRGFANVAGAGFDAAIMQAAAPLKGSLGAAAYFVGAVRTLTPQTSRFEITLDGEQHSLEGIVVLIVNIGRLQFDLPLTPHSDPADGIFEVAVLRTRNIAGLLPAVVSAVFDRMAEYADRSDAVSLFTAREVHVTADPSQRIQYDGEIVDATTPFTARMLPGAAHLLVPPGSPALHSTG